MNGGEPAGPFSLDAAEPRPMPRVIPPVIPPVGAPPRAPDLSREDVPCLNCGYNLRGLTRDGACPECGTPVQRSLQGNLFIFSAPEYLRALVMGLVCILVAVLARIGVMAVGIPAAIIIAATNPQWTGMVEVGMSMAAMPVSALSLYGWWLFSAPDPAILGMERGDAPRRIIRITVVVVACTTVVELAGQWMARANPASEVLQIAAEVLSGAAGIGQFFASMLYVRWLAPRIPSPALERRAGTYMWLLPLIFVLGACVMVGPIVSYIMYFLMLNEIRVFLKAIRARRALEVAAMA
jgi:hypothetical protein